MSLININNLSFAYDSHHEEIFNNVSLQLQSTWKIGLIGRNGRGKTTLLNILQNKLEYTGVVDAKVDFEYFPYEVEDKSQLTINVIEQINPLLEQWQIERELNILEVNLDVLYQPYETLSNGEQTKVLLATMFLKQDNFLLIDEPTNHLDSEGRALISKYLKSKKGFILVSHDRDFLDNSIDYVLSINRSNIELQKGNYSSWNENRIKLEINEQTNNDRLQKDIKRLTESARKTEQWSDKIESSKTGGNKIDESKPADKGFVGHKAAKMMKRSKSTQKRFEDAIDKKRDLLQNVEEIDDLKITSLKHHHDLLVEIKDLSISYDNRVIVEGVSFEIRQQDRIALQGKNGSGKSSILKLLLEEDIEYHGLLNKASKLKISYVNQDTSFLCGKLDDFIIKSNIDETQFKSILRKLGFSREQFEKSIDEYSSGQKKKVLIARSLCEEAHLYIWDEPLNYLDIISRIQLEKLFLEYKPTIIFVEHDKTFLNNVATKIITL